MDDRVSGKLIGKGSGGYNTHYTVSITVKDGRNRYEISDFYEKTPGSQYISSRNKPIEDLIYNPRSKNKKGEYRAIALLEMKIVNDLGDSLAQSIKETMLSLSSGSKSKDDF